MSRAMLRDYALSGILVGCALALLLGGCGGDTAPPASSPDASVTSADAGSMPPEATPDAGPRSVAEARILHPRAIDLHVNVIKRSCSPNPGVCHNDGNYPDLRTPGALIATIGAPCNVDIPEPTQGWDACERKADVVAFDDGFTTAIAWTERIGPGRWRLGLLGAPLVTDSARAAFYTADGEVVLNPLVEWMVHGQRKAGEKTMEVTVMLDDAYVAELIDVALRTLVGGDPNRNGTWGADAQPGRLVMGGDLAKSYLWGRLTATVPGTRMPLANQPLSNADYAALACWIEQAGRAGAADGPETLIDYDACEYARAPLDPVR